MRMMEKPYQLYSLAHSHTSPSRTFHYSIIYFILPRQSLGEKRDGSCD